MELELIDKIKERKKYLSNLAYSYNESPKLSIIVTSFNQKQNIKKLIESLRKIKK